MKIGDWSFLHRTLSLNGFLQGKQPGEAPSLVAIVLLNLIYS